MVGGINTTLANVIVAVVMVALVAGIPLAVWFWNRRTGRFGPVQWSGKDAVAPPTFPAPAPQPIRPTRVRPSEDARLPWDDDPKSQSKGK